MNDTQQINKMRDQILISLKAQVKAVPGAEFLCQILASWIVGCSSLPNGLGLGEADFNNLLGIYFQNLKLPYPSSKGEELDNSRLPEREELERFLKNSQVQEGLVHTLWTQVLVAGLTGGNHLWEDMGFYSRSELSAFLLLFFPKMAEKNVNNMKWKKFIYKQLCEIEEIGYTCRSPSCQVCPDYNQCFDTEQGFWP